MQDQQAVVFLLCCSLREPQLRQSRRLVSHCCYFQFALLARVSCGDGRLARLLGFCLGRRQLFAQRLQLVLHSLRIQVSGDGVLLGELDLFFKHRDEVCTLQGLLLH